MKGLAGRQHPPLLAQPRPADHPARTARVSHQKFGYGHVTQVDGNKLTIAFDKAGEKRVMDSFVDKA